MKKLLILMMVFGMASTVSALPVITGLSDVPQGGSITLTVTGTAGDADTDSGTGGDKGFSGVLWIDYGAYSYQISNVSTATAEMGGGYDIDTTSYLAIGGGVPFVAAGVIPWAETTDVDAAAWFTFTFSDLAGSNIGDTYDVQFLNPNFGSIDGASFIVTVIPEPVTIVLLGLGGLLLRRRK